MKVMVIGSGGREHAICWKLSQDKRVEKIYALPGNAGISSFAECVPIKSENINEIVSFAKENRIDWTIVGPEMPLSMGIVDRFLEEGLSIWGPIKNLAMLEASKAFAKKIMEKAKIPTADFKIFDDFESAKSFVEKEHYPLVIKADGLAAGKGVFIVNSQNEAVEVLGKLLKEGILGEAGRRVVIEKFLEGKEFSLIVAIKDGEIYVLPPAQDYKRVGEGNTGPNTGGMGSFAPVPWIDSSLIEKSLKLIFKPLLSELEKNNLKYEGFLYGGLILVNNEPYVLEFNVRLGDPEAQVILPIIGFSLLDLKDGKNIKTYNEYEYSEKKAVCVVLASKGYPERYEVGKEISVKETKETIIFHAGTSFRNGKLVTSGGRVLNVVGLGKSFKEAREKVYKNIQNIFFENMYYRKDIALEVEDM
uniref:Phosphoribosylamine--glycine ligase n=1 Tax=Dictyoglomus thermophilum TaxID=14 RepID=A0A7C3RM52_DICTH